MSKLLEFGVRENWAISDGLELYRGVQDCRSLLSSENIPHHIANPRWQVSSVHKKRSMITMKPPRILT